MMNKSGQGSIADTLTEILCDKLQFIGLTRMNINYFINFSVNYSLMFILVRPINCSLSAKRVKFQAIFVVVLLLQTNEFVHEALCDLLCALLAIDVVHLVWVFV